MQEAAECIILEGAASTRWLPPGGSTLVASTPAASIPVASILAASIPVASTLVAIPVVHPGGNHSDWWRWRIHHPHHPHWWRWHWRHYPYSQVIVEPGYSTSYVAPTYATSAPAAVATCPSNCLKKQYQEDGSVLFTISAQTKAQRRLLRLDG